MAARLRNVILRYRGKSVGGAHEGGWAAVLPIVALFLAGTEAAQDRDQQWNRCTLYDEHGKLRPGASLDIVIEACTAIIDSGQEGKEELAAAFAQAPLRPSSAA